MRGTLFVGHSSADNAWFSLNLEFNDPTDFNSGGTWTVVGKADERGLSGVTLSFVAFSLNFNPATGFLTPASFDTEESELFDGGLRLETVQGDNLLSPVYNVGVIGGNLPSSYVDNPNLVLFGANPDLGSFTGGVEPITGTFDPGDIPTWWPNANDIGANVFTGIGSQNIEANVFLTVRSNYVPEPTCLMLLWGRNFGDCRDTSTNVSEGVRELISCFSSRRR